MGSAESACHHVDNVLPQVPYRQFVLTLPHALRFWAKLNPILLACIHHTFSQNLLRLYRQKSTQDAQTGGIPNSQKEKSTNSEDSELELSGIKLSKHSN